MSSSSLDFLAIIAALSLAVTKAQGFGTNIIRWLDVKRGLIWFVYWTSKRYYRGKLTIVALWLLAMALVSHLFILIPLQCLLTIDGMGSDIDSREGGGARKLNKGKLGR